MSQWQQLQTVIRNENAIIDNSVNVFTSHMETVLNDVHDRLIIMLNEYQVTNNVNVFNFEMMLENKVNIENMLFETGYYDRVTDFIAEQSKLIEQIKKEYAIFGYDLKFTNPSMIAIRELQKNAIVQFQSIGTKTINTIYDGLYSSLLTTIPYSEVVKNIRSTLEGTGLEKYARTYADTAYMQFNRTVNAVTSQDTGWDDYLYSGPIDGKIRPFCINIIGGIFTKKQIQDMNNGQTSNVFIDGGGYNCRHKWINVPDEYKLTKADQNGIDRQIKVAEEQQLKKAA